MKNSSGDYVIEVFESVSKIAAAHWDELLAMHPGANPFMAHAYLWAMEHSASSTPKTGWTPRFITLWRGGALYAACPLYIKTHSLGEFVFDWAWANAYAQHGLNYYPKAVVAVPFTPVPGPRLLARDAATRSALLQATLDFCRQQGLSSLHVLFASDHDIAAANAAGLMQRHTVQFHWANETQPAPAIELGNTSDADTAHAHGHGTPWPTFDAFLASLTQEKRKKIRQERRKVVEAGVSFRALEGRAITDPDWDFFYRCHERTYHEHGNPPYLSREFFHLMAKHLAQNWLMFVAERAGRPIATSLIALEPDSRTAYGRYWGALERVDCLHFEACYYQPLQWCIANGYKHFEGGAQGEHKMARALLPVSTSSSHWLAHPSFADAVARFLEREGKGIDGYLEHLEKRTPFRAAK